MRRLVQLAAFVALTACQSVSDVVPVGPDTYFVGSQVRGGFSSWAEVKALTLARANDYCAQQGRHMVATNTQTRGARGWTPQEAELTFRCEVPTR